MIQSLNMSQSPEPSPEENISRIYLDSKFVSEQKDVFERNYRIFSAEKFYRLRYLIAAATASSFALAALLGFLGLKARSDYHRNQEAILARANDSEALANRYNTELIDERREKGKISAELKKERGESGKKITSLETMVRDLQQSILDAKSTISSQADALGTRDERIRELDEALAEVNLKIAEYEQNLAKVQEGYDCLDTEVLRLREINKSLKDRGDKAERWAELESVFIGLSDRYLGLVKDAGLSRKIKISSEEFAQLRKDISASKDKFSDLQVRNLDVLMASADALQSLEGDLDFMNGRLRVAEGYAMEYSSVMLSLKKYTEDITPLLNSDGTEVRKILEDIASLKKKCEEEGNKSKAESLSQISGILSTVYGLVVSKNAVERDLTNHKERCRLLQDADQDKAKLAAQIDELNKKIEGLEGRILGLNKELGEKAKEVEAKSKEAEAKSKEAKQYLEDISFFAECLKPYTDVLKNSFLEMNTEDMGKKATNALTSIRDKTVAYMLAGDAQRADRMSQLRDILAGVANVFSAKKEMDGKQAELQKAYEQEQIERKKLIERTDAIFEEINKAKAAVLLCQIQEMGSYTPAIAQLNKVRTEYEEKADMVSSKVIADVETIVSFLGSAEYKLRKKAEELEKRFEEVQQDYDSVIFNSLARSDRDKDTGAVFILFEVGYYKNKGKKEEGLFRVGRYMTPEMVAQLDAFAILAESVYPEITLEERTKKVLSSISDHEQKNSSHFKQAWVRDDAKKGEPSDKYSLVIEYNTGPSQEIRISRKGIAQFARHVALDAYK